MKATKCAWGPFDETLITIHEEGTVFIWNSMTGEEVDSEMPPGAAIFGPSTRRP